MLAVSLLTLLVIMMLVVVFVPTGTRKNALNKFPSRFLFRRGRGLQLRRRVLLNRAGISGCGSTREIVEGARYEAICLLVFELMLLLLWIAMLAVRNSGVCTISLALCSVHSGIRTIWAPTVFRNCRFNGRLVLTAIEMILLGMWWENNTTSSGPRREGLVYFLMLSWKRF